MPVAELDAEVGFIPAANDDFGFVPDAPLESKRASILAQREAAQAEGRGADVLISAARAGEALTEVASQMNPLTAIPRAGFAAEQALGFVPTDHGNPFDANRALATPENVRTAIDALTSHPRSAFYLGPDKPGSVKEGIKEWLSHTVSGLSSPNMIAAASAGGAPAEMRALLGAGFAADMASKAPEAHQAYLDALDTEDPQKITKAALDYATTAGLPLIIAAHGGSGDRPPQDEIPPLREAELRQKAADEALASTLPLSANAVKEMGGKAETPSRGYFLGKTPEPTKVEPNANQEQIAMETLRGETPGPSPQVAAGIPGEVQPAPGAREIQPAEARPEAGPSEAAPKEELVRDVGESPTVKLGGINEGREKASTEINTKLSELTDEPIPKASVPESTPTPDEAQSLGISPTAHPAIRAIANLFNPSGVGNLVGTVKDFFGGYAGRSMPKITRADRTTGELGVRWASSRIAAKPMADVFSTEVLSDSGIDPKKFGTALTEDNLRSVREGFVHAGDAAAAARVHTVIGSRGSPFTTEATYQAFLADPGTQAAIARYKQLWDAQIDPMYKNAMFIDPAEVLPDRGLQTGARVNLMAVQQATPSTVQGIGQGNLLGTLKRKSPFGIRAKGTGQSYNGNIFEMMQNTFGRQLEIANKNAFETKLVETGNAVIDKPGQHPILKDETTVAFPYVRQRVILPKAGEPAKALSQNRSIYVRKSLAKEYSRASNTETKLTGGPVAQFITSLANRSALAGFTDATVHTSNLATVLMTRPAIAGKWWADTALSATGRADLIPIAYRAIAKAFKNNAKQIAELSEIGAMRQAAPPSSKFNPMGWLSDLIHIADKTTRLVMDDAFKQLVSEGLVKDTETNRREWVNQVGQYNKRLQGKWTAAGRDSGLSPFITAGKNFTTLGVKNVTLNPGVKASNLASAAALRANVAAKWIGLGVLSGTLNYLLTKDKKGGGMMGRPGTPVGDVDSGRDDENGRPLVFPLTGLLGLGRGLRVTGIRGYTEAKRKGLPTRVAMDAAVRDIINSQASMISGPPVKLAVEGATGFAPAVNVGRALPVVPPGESQHLADIKGALIEANPILASIQAAHEPGGSTMSGVQKQFPRFTLAPKQPPQMLEKYPEIVRKAQAGAYIDDVIRRARKMAPESKMKFLNEAVQKLAPEDQRHAWEQFKRRRVLN